MQNNVVTSLDMCANDSEWLAKILRRTRFIRSILPPCAVILLTNVLDAVMKLSLDEETLAMRKISAPKEK